MHLTHIYVLASNAGIPPYFPPSKALACLDAVPLDKAKSSAFIDYLNPFLQFQSSLAYLKNPPIGYTLPGVDIIGGLDQIKSNIQSGTYKSQWAFEKDVYALINLMPKDFHLTMGKSMPLSNVFEFITSVHLVSVSADGLAVPQVFFKSRQNLFPALAIITNNLIADLDAMNDANLAGVTLDWTASPLISIDNTPASDFLQVVSLYSNYQDPDALYNQLFYSPAQAKQGSGDGYCLYLHPFGLEDSSSYIFANDTSKPKAFSNFAYLRGNFSDINSGSDLFTASVLPPTITATPTTAAAIKARALASVDPYPTNPVAVHPQGYIAGYFLDGYDDTCVLAMSAFEGSNNTDTQDSANIQLTIQNTLSSCTAAGKTKLIVDLSANGGGIIFNGYV
jgi:hypothetical protein